MFEKKKCLWCGLISNEDELDMNEHDEPSFCPECGRDQFADYIPEWIDCRDELPIEDGRYLTVSKESVLGMKCISITAFACNLHKLDQYTFNNEPGWYYFDSNTGNYSINEDITHWMYLPNPPDN